MEKRTVLGPQQRLRRRGETQARSGRSGQFWVRTSDDAIEGEERLFCRTLLLPAESVQKLPHRLFADSDPASDLAVGIPLGLQAMDPPGARGPKAPTAPGVSSAIPQRREAAVLVPSLVAANGPCRAVESSGHVVLVGPSLLDQADHRLGLRHAVTQGVLPENEATGDHQPVTISGLQNASVVDDDGGFRRRKVWEKNTLSNGLGHTRDHTGRPEKADSFGSAPPGT